MFNRETKYKLIAQNFPLFYVEFAIRKYLYGEFPSREI